MNFAHLHRSGCLARSETLPRTIQLRVAPTSNLVRTAVRTAVRRSCSTTAGTETLHLKSDGKSIRIVVDLPSRGKQLFTIPPILSSFLESLSIDDPEIKSIKVTDLDGIRIARNTRTKDLTGKGWMLNINDKKYTVQVPIRTDIGKVDIETVKTYPGFDEIREYVRQVKSEAETLQYVDYLKRCQDVGLNEQQALDIVNLFHAKGEILYLENNLELNEIIFLHPEKISSSIELALDLEHLRRSQEQKIQLIAGLRAQMEVLHSERERLLSKADTQVQVATWSIFAGLCGQFLLFARFTWWDFSWDVMEPVTYFTSVTETAIAGYLYYLLTREEYSNMDKRMRLVAWRFKQLCKKFKFDEVAYGNLNKKIGQLEAELRDKEMWELMDHKP